MSKGSHAPAMLPADAARWPSLPLPVGMGREWGWLVGLVLADALWCWQIDIRISHLWPQLLTVTGLAVLGIGYRHCGRSRRIADACEVTALWVGLSIAGCVLTYLVATWSLAPYDAVFDRLDAMMGFDWLGWERVVAAHRLLRWPLAIAYASFIPQLLLAILYLAFTGRRRRNRDLFCAAFLALVITALISGLLPALSAFSLYGLPERAPYLPDLMALRGGGGMAFAAPQLQGIITFPSYHAVLAVLVTWSFRRTGMLGITLVGWNLLMLMSIPSEGGHYLVDVIAGIAVAVVAICLVRESFQQHDQDPVTVPADVRRP